LREWYSTEAKFQKKKLGPGGWGEQRTRGDETAVS